MLLHWQTFQLLDLIMLSLCSGQYLKLIFMLILLIFSTMVMPHQQLPCTYLLLAFNIKLTIILITLPLLPFQKCLKATSVLEPILITVCQLCIKLVAICKILGNICISEYETLLFRAAYRLAFFGLFRVSELVFTSSQQPDQPLQVSDVLCTTKAGQNILRIRQRKAKCNQTGKPYIIDIPAIESTECPLLAMEAFLKIRPHKSVYLFCHINGQPLTRYQFGAVLNKAITALNLPTTHFRTHSFRIGAALWLASKGVSYETIKKMGRWQSNSFLKYIRL